MTPLDPPSGRCPGMVHLVGAGPGDPELLTLKAARVLAAADCVIYDRLVDDRVLGHAAPGAELVFAGKRRACHHLQQTEINELIVARAWAGEEIAAMVAAHVPFEIVPGITAALGCAASAVIPLTHRDHARTLVLATGHTKDGEPDLNWAALCQPEQTLVFYMGHQALPRLCARLIEHGLAPHTPAAMVENGTLASQRTLRASLAELPGVVAAAALSGPALLVIGTVAGIGHNHPG